MLRLASVSVLIVSVSMLFPVFKSVVSLVTVAVFVMLVLPTPAPIVTVYDAILLLPAFIVPRSHVTTPPASEQSAEEENVKSPGSVSVTVTLFASDGPELLTVTL